MHAEIQKLIEIQNAFARALFNTCAIDLKEFNDLSNVLEQLRIETERKRQEAMKPKWYQFFKRNKK